MSKLMTPFIWLSKNDPYISERLIQSTQEIIIDCDLLTDYMQSYAYYYKKHLEDTQNAKTDFVA